MTSTVRMMNLSCRLLKAILLCLLLLGCTAKGSGSATKNVRSWGGDVRVYGALRAMFHEGQTSAMVTMDTMLPNPDLYAVGALSDLLGEVTVIAGNAYLAYPEGADATRTVTFSNERFGDAPCCRRSTRME